MGKMVFSWMIKKDSKIPGTVVRASTIPEQLGRISYLLTDKTGNSASCASVRQSLVVSYPAALLCGGFCAPRDQLLIGPFKITKKKKFKVSHLYTPLEHNTSTSALPQA